MMDPKQRAAATSRSDADQYWAHICEHFVDNCSDPDFMASFVKVILCCAPNSHFEIGKLGPEEKEIISELGFAALLELQAQLFGREMPENVEFNGFFMHEDDE